MGVMTFGTEAAQDVYAGVNTFEREATLGPQETLASAYSMYQLAMHKWMFEPVKMASEAFGIELDPWQCDALEAVMVHDNVAVRACHGVGKTALEAVAILWFTITRQMSRVPTTAPTFNKQVRDILWSEVHLRWQDAQKRAPWLTDFFDINVTKFFAKATPQTWFAVGIPSAEAIKAEGYHSPHLLAVIDEAKGVKKQFFEALEGMRTTQEAKMLAVSTPGGPLGYFYDIFVRYRSTWKSQFIIHPDALRGNLIKKKAVERRPSVNGGVYYSKRVRKEWVEARAIEWGVESPTFVARVMGEFPEVSGDSLIQYGWVVDAENREQGAPGVPAVSCDVARYGRDRTVIFGGVGGSLMFGETIARSLSESTDPAAKQDIGPDPRRPRYRSIVATAERCVAMRRRVSGVCGEDRVAIVVDDTGLNGVCDILKEWGEYVVPISFGAAPTDRPRDAEDRARRQRRHLLDSRYVNIKSEMGWSTRTAFELGAVAMSQLPPQIIEPLVQQCAMMKYELDSNGRLRIVDPDEQDEYAAAAGLAEGKKSPDHFHSLMLYLFIALEFSHAITPHAGPKLPKGIKSLGHGAAAPVIKKPVGQAAWIMKHFR